MKYYFRTTKDILDSGYDAVKLRDWDELWDEFGDEYGERELFFDEGYIYMTYRFYEDLIRSEAEGYIDVSRINEYDSDMPQWLTITQGGNYRPDWTYHAWMFEPYGNDDDEWFKTAREIDVLI